MALALAVLACGSDDGSDPGSGGGGSTTSSGGGIEPWSWQGCLPGERDVGGTCVAAAEGAGVDSCASGFTADGEGACAPVLPAAPCPSGQIAIPGDAACRPIADCGNGTWGDIVTAASTQYVDIAYSGGNSSGSASAPWTTIQDAVSAAASGATVAIAAGNYAEDVVDDFGKPVVFWGRCPEMVSIASLSIGGVGSEARGFAILGTTGYGVTATAGSLLLDQVWLHDTADTALLIYPGAAVTLRDSLLERATGTAIQVTAGEVTVERSQIRDTLDELGDGGRALSVRNYTASDTAKATVTGSLFEGGREVGIFVRASALELNASVVRNTMPRLSDMTGGIGIHLQGDPTNPRRPSLSMSQSVVSSNTGAGLSLTGADAIVDRSTIESTAAGAVDQLGGWGINASFDASTGESTLGELRRSVVRGNHDAGVLVIGGELLIEDSIVRSTMERASDQSNGLGVAVQDAPNAATRSKLVMRNSLVEDSRMAGVMTSGADLEMDGCVVRNTVAQLSDNLFGRGINIQPEQGEPPSAALSQGVVDHNVEVGVFVVGTAASLDEMLVENTAVAASGAAGWGIGLQGITALDLPTSATVSACHVDANRGAGIGVITAQLSVSGTLVSNTTPQGQDLLGDGIVALSDTQLAGVIVSDSRVESSSRAGIASFGGSSSVTATQLVCNSLDLNADAFSGFDPVFDDAGGNVCGCEMALGCHVEGATLAPPEPLP